MRRIVLARWFIVLISFHGLVAQSVLFVSPSTKGLLTMSCAEGALTSFEQLHYLAAAHYLAATLCPQSRIESAVGMWKGRVENSGMIDGCPNDRARELGSLLARYYHQEQALVFERHAGGETSLISFRASQPLGVISIMMTQAKVSGATVVPHMHENLVLIVVTDPEERARALSLCSSLHGQEFHEEAGNTELIGDRDRGKAREIFSAIITKAPADVRQLGNDMYSEQFDSELKAAPEATPAN